MSVNDYRTQPTTELFTVQNGATEKSTTFVFGNEDHTLGNALRHILINRPDTEFCGYSVPHPYEPKMNIRLQTYEVPAIQVLRKGLEDLEETANLFDDKFLEALGEFKTQQEKNTSKKGKSSLRRK